MRNIEGLTKIPEWLKEWYRDQGVTKLPDFLKPTFIMPIIRVPDWVLGEPETLTVPATAGNVDYSITVPVDTRYLLLRLRLSLTTDATVANRYLSLQTLDKDDNILIKWLQHATAITASQTQVYNWAMEGQFHYDRTKALGQDLGHFQFPAPIILTEGMDVKLVVTNGVAGDSLSGFAQVLKVKGKYYFEDEL